jgi:hypothetical protein
MFASYSIGIFQGLANGLPECQILQSSDLRNSDKTVVYSSKLSQGWLVPLVNDSTMLKIVAAGTYHGSHVKITPRNGTPIDHWLVSGESEQVLLQAGEGPWQLDVDGGYTSNTKMEFQSRVERPLLYGSNLQHVEMIKQRLNP